MKGSRGDVRTRYTEKEEFDFCQLASDNFTSEVDIRLAAWRRSLR